MLNRRTALLAFPSLALLTACEPTPVTFTYAEAVAFCTEQARNAAGPRVGGQVGISSGSNGNFANLGIMFTDSFLRGDDPDIVYNGCLQRLNDGGQIVADPVIFTN